LGVFRVSLGGRVLLCRLEIPNSHHVSKGCISKEIEKPHTILLTNVMKWDVGFHAALFQLKRKGIRAHREGHCVDILLVISLIERSSS
jgi:hypothetical protein